jgi:undecaprenyl diphosphate synthase
VPENVVQVLTVYAFSTENWNRAQSEIDLLMDIFVTQSNEILIESKKRNVQVKVLSSAPEKLPTFVQEKFHELEREKQGMVVG